MQNLIDKYSDFEPNAQDSDSISPQKRTVVLTGATSVTGAHILSQLVSHPEVEFVYCLVRAKSNKDANQRIVESLFRRKLYHTLLLSDRTKIIALPSDISDADLGLSTKTYKAVAEKLSHVIHYAWTMTLDSSVDDYEEEIAGVHNLLEICIAKSTYGYVSFDFCSSTSIVSRGPEKHISEQLAQLDWTHGSETSESKNQGYAQSICVAEHLCAMAAEKTGVKTRVLRVGQVLADRAHDEPEHTQHIATLMQSAHSIGALPKLQNSVSCMPVKLVAKAVSEIALSHAGSIIANVLNKEKFSWANDLLPSLEESGLQFEVVDPEVWNQRWRALCSQSSSHGIQGEHFADLLDPKNVGNIFASSKTYETSVARKFSPTLDKAPNLDVALIKAFKSHYRAPLYENPAATNDPEKQVIVVAGPCGSGKSTIANYLFQTCNYPIIEGDDLHSPEAVSKMASGVPLTDDDRAPWLDRIKYRALGDFNNLECSKVVVSCSSLKKKYRDSFRSLGADGVSVVFLDLQVSRIELLRRMQSREGHFMKVGMVDSQLAIYESPTAEEVDVLPVDATQSEEDVKMEVLELLQMYWCV